MDYVLTGAICFAAGVYFAEPVRKVAPILEPK